MSSRKPIRRKRVDQFQQYANMAGSQTEPAQTSNPSAPQAPPLNPPAPSNQAPQHPWEAPSTAAASDWPGEPEEKSQDPWDDEIGDISWDEGTPGASEMPWETQPQIQEPEPQDISEWPGQSDPWDDQAQDPWDQESSNIPWDQEQPLDHPNSEAYQHKGYGQAPSYEQETYDQESAQEQEVHGQEPASEQEAYGQEPAHEQEAYGQEPAHEHGVFESEPVHEQEVYGQEPASEQEVYGQEPAHEQEVYGQEPAHEHGVFEQESSSFGHGAYEYGAYDHEQAYYHEQENHDEQANQEQAHETSYQNQEHSFNQNHEEYPAYGQADGPQPAADRSNYQNQHADVENAHPDFDYQHDAYHEEAYEPHSGEIVSEHLGENTSDNNGGVSRDLDEEHMQKIEQNASLEAIDASKPPHESREEFPSQFSYPNKQGDWLEQESQPWEQNFQEDDEFWNQQHGNETQLEVKDLPYGISAPRQRPSTEHIAQQEPQESYPGADLTENSQTNQPEQFNQQSELHLDELNHPEPAEHYDYDISQQTVIRNEGTEGELVSERAKALALLDLDDDLLLDDDFLDEEEPKDKAEVPVTTTPKEQKPAPSIANKYARPERASEMAMPPKTTTSMIPPPSSAISFQHQQKDEVVPIKKRNDAYDFPDTFVKQQIKPARRAPSAQPNYTPQSGSAPQADTAHLKQPTGPPVVEAPKKAFFEDLPGLPNHVKPSRPKATMSSMATPQPPAATIGPAAPSTSVPPAVKSAPNPYAKLAPKAPSSLPPAEGTGAGNRYQPSETNAPPLGIGGIQGAPQGMMPPQSVLKPSMPQIPSHMAPGQMPKPQMGQPQMGQLQMGQPQMGQMPPSNMPMQQVPMQNMPNNTVPAGAPPKIVPPLRQGSDRSLQGSISSNSSAQNGFTVSPPVKNRAEVKPRVNTATAKTTEKSNNLSPYIPDTGPYGPPARGHSRSNSLMGGNAKEGNPYAPAPHGAMGNSHSPNSVHSQLASQSARKRGKSGGRSTLPTIVQATAPKIENPAALLKRQFPIFGWNQSDRITVLIPHAVNGFAPPQNDIKVCRATEVLPKIKIHGDFPGPLSKLKSKKKDIEAFLENNIKTLQGEAGSSDELLLSEILLVLVKSDKETSSAETRQELARVLTPNVDFSYSHDINSSFLGQGGPGYSANAFKLDNAGISVVWGLIQAGNRENALNFAISKQDWALAFIIAQSIGQASLSKVSADFARVSFPFQTNQNTRVQHLMPLLLKIFAGNIKSVIDDFENVPSEAEFARSHYREIISASIVNNGSIEFLVEYGHFLAKAGLTCASEICFMIAGLVMSPNPLQNGAIFPLVGSFTRTSVYSEIYEYVLLKSPTNALPPNGLAHLLPYKIKRAQLLADLGLFSASRKYCDHVSSALKALGKASMTPHTTSDFRHLVERLSEYSANESGWLGSKFSKVNLDKVWGQLDKFIGGDDSTPKPNENGVFSKFSPTISRTPSVLDFSAHHRPDLVAPPPVASAPPAEFASPPQINRTGSKYAPSPMASATSPQRLYKSQHDMRMMAQNGSSTSLNQYERKTASTTAAMPRNQLYSNRNAHHSSSSIASRTDQLKDPRENPARLETKEAHSRKSSLQSELSSMEGELEVNEVIPETIQESPEMEEKVSRVGVPEEHLLEEDVSRENDTKENVSEAPKEEFSKVEADVSVKDTPESKVSKENKTEIPGPPPFRGAPKRSNPYAPSARSSSASRSVNRYGPSSQPRKYEMVKPTEEITQEVKAYEVTEAHQVSKEPHAAKEENDAETQEEVKETESDGEIDESTRNDIGKDLKPSLAAPIPAAPPAPSAPKKATRPARSNAHRSNAYAPPAANIDVSFDQSNFSEEPESPEEKKPLMFNPVPSPAKNGYGNPYQGEKRGSADLNLHGSFEDYPIPGSPELSTRANSVIGNPGLYSSRLSQSQQSALYQQYEVKDDTVLDYVPVPEEEDEEDDVRTKKQNNIKKDRANAKLTIQEELRKRGAGQNAENGWFRGWLGSKSSDDKPKPIRAKMGQANTYKYDDKLQRWIDTSRPLEEQLKESAPPPPPKKKAEPKPAEPVSAAPKAPAPKASADPATPSKKGPTKAASRPNLANAGLDDLLSMTGSGAGAGRKGKRRYVNVMEK